ncbi:MAG: FAD-dependent oxidoreductase [Phycisphaerales bacterium JB052]
MSPAPIHCDVLIIGAGIAGIAIAERISREAMRRNKQIKIVVADSAPMLASGSSSGLQGWFHTGSLYTRLNSSESYLNCVRSHNILERDYANADDFHYRQNCNLDAAPPNHYAWFGAPIQFVLDKSAHPSWNQHVNAMTNRLHALGGVLDPARQIDTNRYTTISTPDRSMVTSNIIADLTDSAIRNGTEFLTGHRAYGLDRTDENEPIMLEDQSGSPKPIRALHTFITTGYSVPNLPHISFSRRSGIIVSATPCLDAPNIVRIAEDPANNISHIAHPPSAFSETGYSAIGDSTSLSEYPNTEQCIETAYRILQKVKTVFGNQAFQGRRVAWHMARKIEVATEDTDGRTFGPMLCPIAQNRHAVITSKFSLFPSLASLALDHLVRDQFFEHLNEPALTKNSAQKPHLSPMLSQRALGIAQSNSPAYRLCGLLRSDESPDSTPTLSVRQS